MRIIVYGTVQGVGFRPAVHRLAEELGASGYVKNLGSCVEICVDVPPEIFMEKLCERLPPLAKVERYEVLSGESEEEGFKILRSSSGAAGSFLPPDTALCSHCIADISEPSNRRYRYAFTNCTDCGARYSVILAQPFDRVRTSMAQFRRCPACTAEYTKPGDRRFHAQTSSCPICGPMYKLFDSTRSELEVGDVFTVFAAHIDSGSIGIMKAWGGAHVVCSPDNIGRMRKIYRRPQKPFAVMVRDMATAEKYGHITNTASSLLASPESPIVLVKKRGYGWLDGTAPGLDRVGLYLPHTGAQHILFQSLETDAVIMTSANMPGQPMAVLNKACLRLPGDIYLVHNRRIANRVDDSLVLPRQNGHLFLRKSRGYVPCVLDLPHTRTLVALGGDMNGCGFAAKDGRGMATQHIGDVGNYDASLFMGSALLKTMEFAGIEARNVDMVAVDIHPRYASRRLGLNLARKWDVPLVDVQHHVAHMYGLMGEHEEQEMIALACDGTGYGDDGSIWGGEVLASRNNGRGYERIASLEKIPMLGGEKAVEEPWRMLASVCLLSHRDPPGVSDQQHNVFRKMLGKSVETSSAGRYLDMVAAWLDICKEMTYDGEPAMKLEHYMAKGREQETSPPDIVRKEGREVVDTVGFIQQFFETCPPESSTMLTEKEKADFAASMVFPVFRALARTAADAAEERGIRGVGFTGGVSYNLVLDRIVSREMKIIGKKLYRHRATPNGDGGVSYGQAVYCGLL